MKTNMAGSFVMACLLLASCTGDTGDGAAAIEPPLAAGDADIVAEITRMRAQFEEDKTNLTVHVIGADEVATAMAQAEDLYNSGVQTAFLIQRGDLAGDDIGAVIKYRFEELGGTVASTTLYNPFDENRTDNQRELTPLGKEVKNFVQENGADAIAIYLIAGAEGSAICEEAQTDENLSEVPCLQSHSN
jgi:hypothetical protein